MHLDASQLDFFRTHGYLPLPGFFAPRHVAALRERLEELRAAPPSPGAIPSPFRDLAREDATFYRHARHPGMLDIAEQLVGLPLELYTDRACVRPPGDPGSAPRQDDAWLRIEPVDQVLACWTAVDMTGPDAGCEVVYPGSHLEGPLPHGAEPGFPEPVARGLDPAGSLPIALPAGSLMLCHALTAHAASPNRSGGWIRVVVTYYVRSGAAMNAREPNSSPLLEMRA